MSFLISLCHFKPLHDLLDISRAITAESLPLHIVSEPGTYGLQAQVANH